MTHEEIRAAARARGLGRVYFQFNVARNTGELFEVGYVFTPTGQELFCKRQPRAEAFRLCNQFADNVGRHDKGSIITKSEISR